MINFGVYTILMVAFSVWLIARAILSPIGRVSIFAMRLIDLIGGLLGFYLICIFIFMTCAI